MTDTTKKPTEPKKLADMTPEELDVLIETEETAHRKRQKYLKALMRAIETEPVEE